VPDSAGPAVSLEERYARSLCASSWSAPPFPPPSLPPSTPSLPPSRGRCARSVCATPQAGAASWSVHAGAAYRHTGMPLQLEEPRITTAHPQAGAVSWSGMLERYAEAVSWSGRPLQLVCVPPQLPLLKRHGGPSVRRAAPQAVCPAVCRARHLYSPAVEEAPLLQPGCRGGVGL
jgi:hypothetical protein